jgi:hypothetical protein
MIARRQVLRLGAASFAARRIAAAAPALRLVSCRETPVLTKRHPGAAGNRYGFEGGRVVKVDSVYHLFTSEMAGDPIWVRMRFGHWRSRDGIEWQRVSTLFASSGEFAGRDPRAALWSPLPVFDDGENRWNLFYVAYRSAPSSAGRFLLNHEGRIWRAVSRVRGRQGIGGPYADVGIVMQPGPGSDPWEGLQGTDSFFPYKVGREWRAIYGSAKTQVTPIEYWLVGLAAAPNLPGPWKRVSASNPLPIEKVFIENPIVEPLPGGGYLCVYDCNSPDAIGFAHSPDGLRWEPGHALKIQPKPGVWSKDVRTPLGLVHEGGGEYSVFYTGFEAKPDWTAMLDGKGGDTSCAIGLARVSLDPS